MQIRILVFGSLTDIIKGNELTLHNRMDTNSVLEELNSRYPALITAKYIMAVDKQTVTENTILQQGSTIALLPPFSGG